MFEFVDEGRRQHGDEAVVFDIAGGGVHPSGELCTFEVLVRSFGIKDNAVRKIAEIVHDLDMKDDRYHAGEAAGVEEILTGIRGPLRTMRMRSRGAWRCSK